MADETNTEKVAQGGDIQPPLAVHQSLIPKEGKETSSYRLALVSALAPVALLLVIIIGLAVVSNPKAQDALTWALLAVLASVLGGTAIGVQYVAKRGNVAVAKTQALGQIIAAREAPEVKTEAKKSK
jgi:hypothetical protein